MIVGEAPGAEEDVSGLPFVGKAGQLLTRMLAAIGLSRSDVYIGNVLKCRPPANRPPAPDEIVACRPYLREQIELLRPELLLLLGNHATRAVLGTDRGITSLRGRIATSPEGWKTLPTYHPAYLLRTPGAKAEAWMDLKLAASTLGLALPARDAPAPTSPPEPE
jgi:uracil-DNA glycosylase